MHNVGKIWQREARRWGIWNFGSGVLLLWAGSLMLLRRVKQIPIVDDEKLVGIVTLTDIIHNVSERFWSLLTIIFQTDISPPETRPVNSHWKNDPFSAHDVLPEMLYEETILEITNTHRKTHLCNSWKSLISSWKMHRVTHFHCYNYILK